MRKCARACAFSLSIRAMDNGVTGSKRKERKRLYDKRNSISGRKRRSSKVKRLQETLSKRESTLKKVNSRLSDAKRSELKAIEKAKVMERLVRSYNTVCIIRIMRVRIHIATNN